MRPIFICILCLFTLGPVNSSSARACFKIGYWTVGGAEKIAADFITEVYSEAGLCVDLLKLPLRRAEYMLESQRIDGNIWRSDEFLAKHKDKYLGLSEPLITQETLLVYDSALYGRLQSKDALQGEVIGVIAGDLHAKVTALEIGGKPEFAPKYGHLIPMLNRHRFSAAIVVREVYERMAFDTKLQKNFTPLKLPNTVFRHVILAAHKDYLPQLNQAMRVVDQKFSFAERMLRFQKAGAR